MLKIRHFQAILSQKKAHFCTSVADIEKVSQLFVNNTITYISNCYMGQKRYLIDEFPFFFKNGLLYAIFCSYQGPPHSGSFGHPSRSNQRINIDLCTNFETCITSVTTFFLYH